MVHFPHLVINQKFGLSIKKFETLCGGQMTNMRSAKVVSVVHFPHLVIAHSLPSMAATIKAVVPSTMPSFTFKPGWLKKKKLVWERAIWRKSLFEKKLFEWRAVLNSNYNGLTCFRRSSNNCWLFLSTAMTRAVRLMIEKYIKAMIFVPKPRTQSSSYIDMPSFLGWGWFWSPEYGYHCHTNIQCLG